jgi:hypothetical protein
LQITWRCDSFTLLPLRSQDVRLQSDSESTSSANLLPCGTTGRLLDVKPTPRKNSSRRAPSPVFAFLNLPKISMARVTRPFTVEVKRHKFSIKANTADDLAGVAPTLDQLIQASPRLDRPLSARPAPPDDARAAAEAVFAGMAAAPREPVSAVAGGPAPSLSATSGRVLEDLTAPMSLLQPAPEATPRGRRPKEHGLGSGDAAGAPRREAKQPQPKGVGEAAMFRKAEPDRADAAARAKPGRPKREATFGDTTTGAGAKPRKPIRESHPKKRFDLESLTELPVVHSTARVQVVVQADEMGEPRGSARRAERPLRRGEQWKRRLPKVCW